ncbi:hypothetical protein ACFPM7_10055 [Actinokineospora guangxiensis]|uniref:Mce-associated membrane protein n=1 Tax=Actinokineospora guangxiensis TaxID=1490288 RepID=A0ABW0EIZ8_9PSEU
MPIRTNRGRAAVYRKLWGWPLRSPRHLAVAAVVAAVVITAAGIVIPKLSGAESNRRADPGGGSTSTSETHVFGSRTVVVPPATGSAATTETRVEPTLTPSTAPAPPEALTVAADWAKAWVNHPDGMTPQAWREQLRPFTDAESMVKLEDVEPARIPASAVTGEPRVVVSYLKSVVAEVPTDEVLLRLTVVETDQGWKVSEFAMGEG